MAVKQYYWIISCFLFGAYTFALEDQRGAFVQTGEELHFFVDTNQFWSESVNSQLLADGRQTADQRPSRRSGVPSQSHSPSGNNENNSHQGVDENAHNGGGALNQLKFEPPFLEFGYQAVGVPEQKKVKVTNPTASKVRFDAISGSTVHFHCSFFNEKTIEPGSSTTFDVVFLPRREGELKNTLSIHSSLGAFQYVVSGFGTSNPYRLRPFVGAKVPLNGTFIGPLELHNPHPTTLRIVEMFTSGGDLHVDLPVSGRGDGVHARSVWEIPPFQTRTVAKARYIGGRVKNATAYIRIKTDHDFTMINDERRQEALIVPVEIEVTAKAGLYAAVDRLDFGTVIEGEQSRWVMLEIYNTHNQTVEITSVEPDSQLLLVDFRPVISLTSSTRTPTYVAKFAYHAKSGESSGNRLRTGRIILKSQNGRYALTVPYSVQVLEGRLIHDTGQVAFYNGRHYSNADERNITLWNLFDTPVAIYNVSLPKNMRRLFKIQNFNSPVVIPARSSRQVLALSYVSTSTSSVDMAFSPLESRLRLHTNISRFDIPLYLFDGMLRFTLYSIQQKEFDFGLLDIGQERSILFAVTNENPIPISIKNMSTALPMYTTLELSGVEEGNHSVLSYDHSPSEYKWKTGEDFTVPAGSFAVFRFSLTAPNQRTIYHTKMTFKSAFQIAEFPVTFTVEEGDIVSVPEKVVIDDAFPGKISSHALQVYSTFTRDMPLLRLSTLSNDPRFFFESLDKEQTPIIRRGKVSRLGRLFFMPVATCLDDCYVGLPLDTDDGRHWIRGMRLPSDLPEIDVYLYKRLRAKWNDIVERGEHIANSTIMVDSTEVKNYAVRAEGRLVWPRLMKQSAIHFPLTAVGNYTIVNVTLQNPSSLPVAVQLLPLTIYPGPYDLIKMLTGELDAPLTSYVEVDDVLIFSLRDSELYNARPESPVPHLRQELERVVGMQIPRFTLSMLLQPGMKVRVRIGFLPPDYQLRSTLLLIRNNLTGLETTTLYGRGGRLELRIGSKLPSTKQPLLVEVPDKFLKECENLKRLQHKLLTHLTVRRSFVARNTGELPLLISNISISGHSCYDRGFRVLNCEPFRIQPNGTHVLDIAFTPDFTMSWHEASLQLYIPGTVAPLHYLIGASVPPEWLSKCQAAMPRPYWEPLMYYSCVVALGFLLICVIASAYLEGDRIVTCAFKQQLFNYRRRMFELDGNIRPFSLRQAGLENTANSSDNGSVNGRVGDGLDNVFDPNENGLDTDATGDKPRSLPYRLVMLFWYLITKRLMSSATNDNDEGSAHSPVKVPQAQIVVSGRTVRTTLTIPSKPQQIQQDGRTRRSTVSQSTTITNGGVQSTNRKFSEDISNASPATVPKRPPPSQTPPGQSSKTPAVAKNARKRHMQFTQSEHATGVAEAFPHKTSKENLNMKDDRKSGKVELPIAVASKPSISPHQKSHSPNVESGAIRRRMAFVEKENRKSDNENQRRKGDPGRLPLRSRSSREISESEPDERISHYPRGKKISMGKISQAATTGPVDEQKSVEVENVKPDGYILKPDNRATAAAMKKKPEENSDWTAETATGTGESAGQGLKVPSVTNGGYSESEESAIPEWDRASLPSAGEPANFDEAFDQLAVETSTFAASTQHALKKESQNVPLAKLKAAGSTNAGKPHGLSVSTGQTPSLRVDTQLPSPMGNESILSSTSRSNSISSLDASESSSPSPDEGARRKSKPTAAVLKMEKRRKDGGSAVVDSGQKKKKAPTSVAASALTASPRQRQRQIGAIGKKVQAVGAVERETAGQQETFWQKEDTREAMVKRSGVIGEGRFCTPPNTAQASPVDSSGQQKSIMQQLREERMCRLQEHYKKLKSGEEWPGFDMPSVAESLWDDDFDPWRSGINPPAEQRQQDMWGQPTWCPLPGTVGATEQQQQHGPDSPFPSFFDFPSVGQYSGWSTATEQRNVSPADVMAVNQGQQNQMTGVQKVTPPPPADSSIVAWGPAVNAEQHNMPASTLTAPPGLEPAWNTSPVMTGFDITWPQNLLDDEKQEQTAVRPVARGGKTKK